MHDQDLVSCINASVNLRFVSLSSQARPILQTVRRLSLGSLNAAAQNKPQLIREHLGTLLPLLYGETEVKKELMRTVQMGPWKQVFDDGLETRSMLSFSSSLGFGITNKPPFSRLQRPLTRFVCPLKIGPSR